MHASTLFVCLLHASAKRATQKLGFTLHDKQAHIAVVSCGSLRLYLFTHSLPTPDKPTITLTTLEAKAVPTGARTADRTQKR